MTHDNTQSDVVVGCRTCGIANRSHFDHVAPFGEGYHPFNEGCLTSSDAVLEEQAAKRIYEHWSFGTWFKGDKPAWVEGGNSEAQVLARTFAHAAIRKGDNA